MGVVLALVTMLMAVIVLFGFRRRTRDDTGPRARSGPGAPVAQGTSTRGTPARRQDEQPPATASSSHRSYGADDLGALVMRR